MQSDLAGTLSLSGQLLSLHVHDAQILRLHESFRDESRRAQDFVARQAIADIAGISRHEAFVVNSPPDLADFKLELMQVHGLVSGWSPRFSVLRSAESIKAFAFRCTDSLRPAHSETSAVSN